MTPAVAELAAPGTSRLMRTRQAIAAALEAGGLRVATTGQLAAPGVLLEAGDPWAAVESLHGRRVARWKVTLVAGRSDSEGALDTLAELVDAADRALLGLPGVQLPTWAKPFDAQLGAVPYAATVATIQLSTEVLT